MLVLIRTVDIERGNAGIMLIAGHYGKIVSEGRRGNPNVIIGYKKPLGAKVRAYLSVAPSNAGIERQKIDGSNEQIKR